MKSTTISLQSIPAATILLLFTMLASTSFAGSATWKSSPSTGDWNTAANWSPATVPNGSADTATFDVSNVTSVSTSANTEVNSIVFTSGASAFTITASPGFTLTISGAGITNNSGTTQNFTAPLGPSGTGSIVFSNSATAGSGTIFTNVGGPTTNGGTTTFLDNSSAGEATVVNNMNGETIFTGNSTAANGTFTIDESSALEFHDSSNAGHGAFTNNNLIFFRDYSSAADGTFTVDGTVTVSDTRLGFLNYSTASNATLISTGGSIFFFGHSTGGTARVEIFGGGDLDVSQHTGKLTIGSLEGDGTVYLGKLVVGSTKLNTRFSGVIQDGLTGPGSLFKVGGGTLTLSGPNTYSGGTTVSHGKLSIVNATGSGTGSGAVQVNGGTLGGTGKISGAVTVGNGTTSGAILLPGTAKKPGTLTINNTLTFNSMSTYECVLNRATPAAGKVNALGVTINSNATFKFVDTTTGTLTKGTVFTVINNTSANPIFGTFSNLPDGSTFTSNGTTFKANYEGGTGNDLTLKIVP